jgi:hypothetical protein
LRKWWIGGSLALLIIGGAAVAVSWLVKTYAPAFTRERVEAGLSGALGRPVTVGRIELSPWLGYLTVEGVTIAGATPEEPPLLRLRRIDVGIGIASLWRRRLYISRVILDGPELRLDANGAGGAALVLPDPIPVSFAVGPITIELGTIEVRNGHVVVRVGPPPGTLALHGLEGSAWPEGGGAAVKLALTTLRVVMPPFDETVQAIEATGRIRGDAVDLEFLRGRWHGEGVTLSGRITGLGERIDLAVRGKLVIAEVAKLAGVTQGVAGVAEVDGTIRGAPAAPALAVSVAVPALDAGPVTARAVTARLQWRDGQLSLENAAARAFGGTVRGSLTLDPARLDSAHAQFALTDVALDALESLAGVRSGVRATLTVSGEAGGNLQDLTAVNGSARFESGDLLLPGDLGKLGRATVRGEAGLGGGAVDVRDLEAHWPGLQARARGRVGLDGVLGLHTLVAGDVQRLGGAWGLRQAGGQASLAADISGPWDRPAVTGTLRASPLTVEGFAVDVVEVPFDLSGDTLRVERAEVRRASSRLHLDGSATWPAPRDLSRWREALRGQADVSAAPALLEDIAPWLPAEWRGRGAVALKARAEGTASAWQVTGRADAARLTVRDQTIEGIRAPFFVSAGGIETRGLRARVLGIPVAGEVRWGWEGSGDAKIDVGPVPLARLPRPSEAIAVEGTARGRVEATVQAGEIAGSATIDAEGVGVAGISLGRGTGRASIQSRTLAATLSFPEARISATAGGRLTAGERIAVDLRAEHFKLATLAEGSRSTLGPIGGELSVIAVGSVPFWDPALVQIDSAAITATGLEVGGVALGRGSVKAAIRDGVLTSAADFPDARISATASGRLAPGSAVAVTARVQELELAPLVGRFAPEGLGPVQGAVSMVAELLVPVSDPMAATGRAQLDPLRLTLAREEWQGAILLRREPALLRVDRLTLRSRLGAMTASGTVTDAGALDFTADGQIPLAVVARLRPEIVEAEGVADARLRIGGTARAPAVTGEGTIRDGRIALRDYPDPIRDLHAQFTLTPRAARVSEVTATFAGGQIRGSGEATFEAGGVGTYRFTLTGREVSLTPLPDLQTAWDADLEIVGRATRTLVRGEARLLRALYTRDISLLREILQRRPTRVEAREGGIYLDVGVLLQDNIVVRTSVATLRAGGSLRLQGTTSAPIVFGTLAVSDGELTFRRNKWTVTSATARFLDPRRLDPLLDVQARAQIRQFEITMHMTGPTDNLEIQFTSVPPLPEDEVLALVAFGQTRSQVSQGGAGALVGEAAGFIVEDLFGPGPGNVARLDVMEVDTAESGARAVRVGKRLTPNTLVVYSQGISNADQRKLRIEYQVFGPLVLAGEQDFRGGFGGDVLLRVRFR